MKSFACFGKKLQHLRSYSYMKFSCYTKALKTSSSCLYRLCLLLANPIWAHLFYFISLSCAGFLALQTMKSRNPSYKPSNLDMFFMSVSATTVSSMDTMEMEFFSNSQLWVLTLLMLIGGEVFVFMLSLQFMKNKLKSKQNMTIDRRVQSNVSPTSNRSNIIENRIESGLTTTNLEELESSNRQLMKSEEDFYESCLKHLALVVLGYLVVIHVSGSVLIIVYMKVISGARQVLKSKQIETVTFAVFTTVSTSASCGFVPTNENMVVFNKNTGLLWILMAQVLFGNTLFPPCLRLVTWVTRGLTKRAQFDYILKNPRVFGYDHLLTKTHCLFLCVTVFGFILLQFAHYCALEWHSNNLFGLTSYQKIVGAFFLSVNSRHAGETTVDLSTISPSLLINFVVMMYLPPYTTFLPPKREAEIFPGIHKKRRGWMKNQSLSQLSYLTVAVIAVCITEREKIAQDPVNFSVLNIVVEVVSAYRNVGFTTGYSCARRMNTDSTCKDAWYGFVGRWSDQGKWILIVVMIFGRLKTLSRGRQVLEAHVTVSNSHV